MREADSFTTAEAVDEATAKGHEQHQGQSNVQYVAAVDIGLVSDPSTIAIAHLDGEDVVLDRLLTFQGSRRAPVRISTLAAALVELAQSFHLSRVRVESYQGAALVEELQRIGLNVELVPATARLHADEWPLLAQRLATGTLVLFPHAKLREELLGLVTELGPQGAKVVDRAPGVHQDHATALRLCVAALTQPGEGASIVEARHLAARPTRVVIRADGEESDIQGYRREQAAWEREAFRREFGGSPFEAEPGGVYGSMRSRWRDGF